MNDLTRQWLAEPRFMCQAHINGEHLESHIFLDKMKHGHSLEGFIEGSMFFGAEYVKIRHDLLAEYLVGHSTPLELPQSVINEYPLIIPRMDDLKKSLGTLLSRCKKCSDRFKEQMSQSA